MGLPTQVSSRERQKASPYPFPLTPLLGTLNLLSAGIIAAVLGDFIYELLGEKMSVPSELILVFAAAVTTAIEQILSFLRQRFWSFPAKANLFIHAALFAFWVVALNLLTFRLNGMVLSHSCDLTIWRTEMGMMVCRLYKAIYSFSVVCVATALAGVILDWFVLRDAAAGVYQPLEDQSADMRKTMSANATPLIGAEKEQDNH